MAGYPVAEASKPVSDLAWGGSGIVLVLGTALLRVVESTWASVAATLVLVAGLVAVGATLRQADRENFRGARLVISVPPLLMAVVAVVQLVRHWA